MIKTQDLVVYLEQKGLRVQKYVGYYKAFLNIRSAYIVFNASPFINEVFIKCDFPSSILKDIVRFLEENGVKISRKELDNYNLRETKKEKFLRSIYG